MIRTIEHRRRGRRSYESIRIDSNDSMRTKLRRNKKDKKKCRTKNET
jgi:hypothetical protein